MADVDSVKPNQLRGSDTGSPVRHRAAAVEKPLVRGRVEPSKLLAIPTPGHRILGMSGPITQRDYYNLNPALGNASGDVWRDLPTLGLLPSPMSAGVVITPACDLANGKAETITYLPVIDVLSWLNSVAFLPEIRRVVDGQWKIISGEALVPWPEGYRIPEQSTIEAANARLSETAARRSLGTKEKTALEKVRAALEFFNTKHSQPPGRITPAVLVGALGSSQFEEILRRIVTNSYRTDLHFLPADRQPAEWSAIPCHSVVLFRYPLTAPLEILEAAQDISLRDWQGYLRTVEMVYPIANAFRVACPTKCSQIKTPFLSDMLARYVGLNMRLGSPDFTEETVASLVSELQRN